MGRATLKPNKGTLRLCTGKLQMVTQNQRVRQKVRKTAKLPTMTQKKRRKKQNSSSLMQKRKTKTSTSSSSGKSWLK